MENSAPTPQTISTPEENSTANEENATLTGGNTATTEEDATRSDVYTATTEEHVTPTKENNDHDQFEEDEVDISYATVSLRRKHSQTYSDVKVESSAPTLASTLAPAIPDPASRLSDPSDADLYASADGDSPSSPCCPQKVDSGFNTNEFEGNANSQPESVLHGDVYAVVDKSRSLTYPTSSSNARNPEKAGEDEDNAYAVVDKTSSRRNAGVDPTRPGPSPGKDRISQCESATDVYAQANKSAKRNNSAPSSQATVESEVELYAQVWKPKSVAKPKPKVAVKPTPPQKPTSLQIHPDELVNQEQTGEQYT